MLELITRNHYYSMPVADINYYVTRKWDGVVTLLFEISVYADVFSLMAEEMYIVESTGRQTYVIKGIATTGDIADVDCALNLEDWRGQAYVGYYNNTASLPTTMAAILPTGWTMAYEVESSQRRSVNLDDGGTPLDIALAAQDSYGCAMRFDNHAKTCTVYYPNSHTDSGVRLTESAGMRRRPTRTGKSTDLVTRIYPVGADGLTIESVNNNKAYVENYSYTDKVICQVWKDERYENATSLMQDAQAMVDSLAVPEVSWEVDLFDLYRADPDHWSSNRVELYQRVQITYGRSAISALVVEEEVHPHHPENNAVCIGSVAPNLISTVRSLKSLNSRYQHGSLTNNSFA